MGVSIPFYFSASLNKSVAYAAGQMVLEVRRQFQNGKILSGEEEPDYDKCIKVATEASLGF